MKTITVAIKCFIKKIMPSQAFSAARPPCPCARWSCSVKGRVASCFTTPSAHRSCLRGDMVVLRRKCEEKEFQLDFLEESFKVEKRKFQDLQQAFQKRTQDLEAQVEKLTLENMELNKRIEILLEVQSSCPASSERGSDATSL
ncbi:uncharacterized protein LOC127750134 [Frankliniella occidentalis]|uniref:Uncharacterized protein LOC127750134 n=1 Tax=Frankliniella occidentalis TaxID=133901 RepID=A0A9C6U7J2_FRAOC|nr:uncharacterized protein LOC127750134 [Frankliniella occidentalis]